MFFRILCLFCVLAAAVNAGVVKEKMKHRMDFIRKSKTDPSTPHEVVIAVKQQNLDVLEKMVLERATPGNPKYQQWMNFDEVGQLVGNPIGAQATVDWLRENGIEVGILNV